MNRTTYRTVFFVAALGGAGCTSDEKECRDLANTSDPACAAAPTAPKFAGVEHVIKDHAGNFLVTWQPGSDSVTPPEKLTYRVYVSRVAGRALHQTPVVSAAGATSAAVNVPPNEDLYVVVRAVNEASVEDGNAVEKRARSIPDVTLPAFAGAQTAAPAPKQGVKIGWAPASDDETPTALIRYVVYGGRGNTIDYSRPLRETNAGATELTLEGLGAPNENWSFVVLARDVAGNVSAERTVLTTPLGNATEPPIFAGCASTLVEGRTLTVTWEPATSPHVAQSAITYEIFLATSAGAQDFASPTTKVHGNTRATIAQLSPGATYFVVCRAVDDVGNRDSNSVEKSASISADTMAPTFAGIKTSTFNGSARSVVLEWDPGADDATPASALVYDVYERTAAGAHAFDAPPRATTAPGANSITLTDLAPEATLYWTVRARDAAFNRDSNVVEVTGTTGASFARQIVPLLRQNCAVVGCHSSGFPAGGMTLSPALAYAMTVNVAANQRPPGRLTPINRITPGDANESYLYLKIVGTAGTFVGSAMPAPGTGNVLSPAEKDVVKNWILQGAPEN